MTGPYYSDDLVTLYHGDCREITDWLAADVLVTDPPYGRAWKQGRHWDAAHTDDRHAGIAGDKDTEVRDQALALWGSKPGIVFGDLMLAPPGGTKLVGVYQKPPNAGARGAIGDRRRDAEAIYWLGPWSSGLGGRSSVVKTAAPSQGNPSSPQGRYGHPHAKPEDVMANLVGGCPSGMAIADPFAGAGSTLAACVLLNRRCIAVEIEECYCELIARRLDQGVLDFGSSVMNPGLVVGIALLIAGITYLAIEGNRDIDDCWTGFRFDNDDTTALAEAVQGDVNLTRPEMVRDYLACEEIYGLSSYQGGQA